MATPTDDRYADTSRTIEELGRDAIARTEAQVIGTSPIERTDAERERDARSKPQVVLELLDLDAGDHAVDLLPGVQAAGVDRAIALYHCSAAQEVACPIRTPIVMPFDPVIDQSFASLNSGKRMPI